MRVLHVKLSDEAHAGWDAFVAEHGITATALVEVLGLRLDSLLAGKVGEEIVREARIVAHERRRHR